jgi:hypothetical protein
MACPPENPKTLVQKFETLVNSDLSHVVSEDLTIAKIILLSFIHVFNTIPIKIKAGFSVEIDKLILNFHGSENHLEQSNQHLSGHS